MIRLAQLAIVLSSVVLALLLASCKTAPAKPDAIDIALETASFNLGTLIAQP